MTLSIMDRIVHYVMLSVQFLNYDAECSRADCSGTLRLGLLKWHPKGKGYIIFYVRDLRMLVIS